ncbi:MAG: hypothetical protein WA989_09360 [Henriciella sp.]|uniref:hypothetical protein n=1 Tax=Henriciella sp. TaxID=1968823 RepID=UPI003C727935
MKYTAPQFTMNAGIYSPELAEREDTEAYYASVRDMLNMRPVAEGGADLRQGLARGSLQRGALTLTELDGVTFTAHASASFTEAGEDLTDAGGGVTDPPVYPGFDPDDLWLDGISGVYA